MLYRGESRAVHDANDGKILPKNMRGEKEVVAGMDGRICMDGRFNCGPSETNRVAAHHISTGMYGGCSVSTSLCYDEAKQFALVRSDKGVVYWIDDDKFQSFGVVVITVPEPQYPGEEEVTIRAADGGEIPAELIVRVDFVERA